MKKKLFERVLNEEVNKHAIKNMNYAIASGRWVPKKVVGIVSKALDKKERENQAELEKFVAKGKSDKFIIINVNNNEKGALVEYSVVGALDVYIAVGGNETLYSAEIKVIIAIDGYADRFEAVIAATSEDGGNYWDVTWKGWSN